MSRQGGGGTGGTTQRRRRQRQPTPPDPQLTMAHARPTDPEATMAAVRAPASQPSLLVAVAATCVGSLGFDLGDLELSGMCVCM